MNVRKRWLAVGSAIVSLLSFLLGSYQQSIEMKEKMAVIGGQF